MGQKFPLVLLQAKAVSIELSEEIRDLEVSISSPSGEGGETFVSALVAGGGVAGVSISSPSGEGGESQEVSSLGRKPLCVSISSPSGEGGEKPTSFEQISRQEVSISSPSGEGGE
jgi:hypothetical protein